jgi:cytochrome c-type biogenesis protein CcmF
MIAEAGLALLWLAASLSLLQLVLGAAALRPGNEPLLRIVRPIAVGQGLLVGLSFLTLIWLFLRTDLSVKLVAANSHSLKPWLYKFAGAWGNHEGSMLLWVTVLAVAGAGVALFERRLRQDTLIATLAAQAAIGLGFYLLYCSPRTRSSGCSRCRSKATASIPCSRIRASPSIRRPFISAMSASRSPSPSRSAR